MQPNVHKKKKKNTFLLSDKYKKSLKFAFQYEIRDTLSSDTTDTD